MGWYFDGTDDVQITNNSALDIPNDDWTFCGWFRKSSNTGTYYERIFAWGTPGGTPHIQVYVPNISAVGLNSDNLSARVIDPSAADTNFIYNAGFTISSNLNKWIPWCLTHDNSTNTNYLRVMHPTSRVTYNANAVRGLSGISTTNITGPLYIGSTNVGGNDRFVGDLSEFAYIPGVFFDTNLWNAFTHGARLGRIHGCKYYLPMHRGRYESWNTKLTVTNSGSSASTSHAPVKLILPKHANESEISPSAGGLRVSKQSVDVFGTKPSDLRFITQALTVGGLTDPDLQVSRVAVEYITKVTVKESGATSGLVLTQEAGVNVKHLEVESTLSLGHTAGAVNDELPAIGVTIPLSQSAGYTLWPVATASGTLVVTQAASFDRVYNRQADSVLSVQQEATYVGPKYVDAQSVIQLEHSVYEPITIDVTAESQIVIGQDTVVGGTKRLTAASAIDLSQVADTIVKLRDASSQLVITQEASYERILTVHSQINLTQSAQLGQISKSAESQLDLNQSARFQPLPQSAESQINLSQSTWANIRYVSASSHIDLVQSERVVKPVRVSGRSELSFTDLIDDPVQGPILGDAGLRQYASVIHVGTQSASDIISFNQVVGLTHVKASGTSASASSSLSLTHSGVLSKVGEGANTINLAHSAQGWAGRPGDSTLELTHEAHVNVVQPFAGSNTLDLRQAAAYSLVVASSTCQYSPFVGATTDPDAPTPPPLALQGPMAGIQVPFQLVYPSTGVVADSQSLKTPNLGNLDRLSFNRIQRETRGGTLVIFADPAWPKIQTLALTFSGLKSVEAQGLLTFIDDHVGQEIGLIDWEHRYWRGVITTPDEPIVEDSFDSFTASFEFQGELDPAWNPQVVPPSLRYSSTRSTQEGGYYVPNTPQLPTVPEADYLSATADSIVKIGYPIYLKATGHLDPVKADAQATAGVVGVAISDATAGVSCKYLTEGKVTRSDWTEVIGVTSLTPGVLYYLSPTTAGQFTSTAPTTVGQLVVPIGRATSATEFDIEIGLPVLL